VPAKGSFGLILKGTQCRFREIGWATSGPAALKSRSLSHRMRFQRFAEYSLKLLSITTANSGPTVDKARSPRDPCNGGPAGLLRRPVAADNAAMKAEPRRKRRWFQFSLRTLFILVLIVATPCAWLGHKIAQKRREREFVEEIRNWGGIVTYDYQIARSKPSGPAWLRSLLGENFFNDVKVVYAAHFRNAW
jgi:hypothetical protein